MVVSLFAFAGSAIFSGKNAKSIAEKGRKLKRRVSRNAEGAMPAFRSKSGLIASGGVQVANLATDRDAEGV